MALGGAPQQNNPSNNPGNKKKKQPEGGPHTKEARRNYENQINAFGTSLATLLKENKGKVDAKEISEEDARTQILIGIEGLLNNVQSVFSSISTAEENVRSDASLNEDQKRADSAGLVTLKTDINKFLEAKRREYDLDFASVWKSIENGSPEALAKKKAELLRDVTGTLGTSLTKLVTLMKRIETAAHGGSISDAEKELFAVELEGVLYEYAAAISNAKKLGKKEGKMKLDVDDPAQKGLMGQVLKIRKQFEDVPAREEMNWEAFLDRDAAYDAGPLLKRVEHALEHSFDEFAETRNHLNEGLDKVEINLLKIKAKLEEEFKKEKKLEDKVKLPFINELDAQEAVSVEIQTLLTEKVLGMSVVAPIDIKTAAQISELERRLGFAASLIFQLREKVEGRPEAKDQRENARQISDRLVLIEKQVKEDGDKRDIGKAFDEGQKATFTILIDAEEIAVREAQDELDLLPDTPENEPTRTMIRSILDKAESRIAKLKESVDKKRVAKEKEVMEKLEAAEKVIEGVEDKIRQINMEEANGKLQMNERKDAVKEKGSLVQRLFEPFVKYQNGLTYHDQKNVNESLSDPKEDITKAREWINDMPESNEKEIKLKKKLMKKARRMMRRRRSAMIRYFFRLPKGEMAKLGGDAMFTRTLDALLGF